MPHHSNAPPPPSTSLSFVTNPWAVTVMYLFRTWLMNCCSGLTKAVLNDYVVRGAVSSSARHIPSPHHPNHTTRQSKKHRAKWNSLESINIFSWSGSAALGGYLIDTVGYRYTFLATASLQALSALMLVPLVEIVHKEKGAKVGAPRRWPRRWLRLLAPARSQLVKLRAVSQSSQHEPDRSRTPGTCAGRASGVTRALGG